jgi:sulfide dehydrogenase [flavocytochrome c] flavoprotein subunit
VGGGAGGATAAKYIARDSAGAIDVTLIEPTRSYYTCFFSNLYIGGFYDFDDLGHTYGTWPRPTASTWCMTGPRAWTATPRPCARRRRVGAYDRLVLSPGIDFIEGSVPGWSSRRRTRCPMPTRAAARRSF